MKTFKILLISYFYPPLRDVGGIRPNTMANYFIKKGCIVDVLSVKNPDQYWCLTDKNNTSVMDSNVYYTYSIMNLTRIIGKINGFLTRILKIFNIKIYKNIILELFTIPDHFFGWIPLTLIKAHQLNRKNKYDFILISSKPFSSAIIGYVLKSFSKTYFIIDYRDPTIQISENKKNAKKLPVRITASLENRILKKVDLVTVVTDKMKNFYKSNYSINNILTIYNGFIEKEFNNFYNKFNHPTIVLNGNLYLNEMDPEPLFIALRDIKLKFQKNRTPLDIIYIGMVNTVMENFIKLYELDKFIQFIGLVDRKTSIKYVMKSHLYIVRILKNALGTKVFEGIAAGTQLLLITEEEEAINLVKNYAKKYYIVKNNRKKFISDGIQLALTDGFKINYKTKDIKYFNRENQLDILYNKMGEII